ncbi:hypothetical protein E2320_012582 [Naja naja]|nr:hypothetical protein E2320_012582 [Naja naja]
MEEEIDRQTDGRTDRQIRTWVTCAVLFLFYLGSTTSLKILSPSAKAATHPRMEKMPSLPALISILQTAHTPLGLSTSVGTGAPI